MHKVTIHEAKTHLSRLIMEVLEGEEVVITKGKTPVVLLVPVSDDSFERKLGLAKGKVWISSDFEEPIDDFEDYHK